MSSSSNLPKDISRILTGLSSTAESRCTVVRGIKILSPPRGRKMCPLAGSRPRHPALPTAHRASDDTGERGSRLDRRLSPLRSTGYCACTVRTSPMVSPPLWSGRHGRSRHSFLQTHLVQRYDQKVMTPVGRRVPAFMRAPKSSTFPSSMTHPAPSTDKPLTTQSRRITAPGPTMELRTIVPSPPRLRERGCYLPPSHPPLRNTLLQWTCDHRS